MPNNASNIIIRNIVNQAFEATMHILHESYLIKSKLWPKKGFILGVGDLENNDIIRITISIHSDHNVTAFNIVGKNSKRIDSQLEAIQVIMSDSIYDNICFKSLKKPSIINVGLDSNLGQTAFNFTLTE